MGRYLPSARKSVKKREEKNKKFNLFEIKREELHILPVKNISAPTTSTMQMIAGKYVPPHMRNRPATAVAPPCEAKLNAKQTKKPRKPKRPSQYPSPPRRQRCPRSSLTANCSS